MGLGLNGVWAYHRDDSHELEDNGIDIVRNDPVDARNDRGDHLSAPIPASATLASHGPGKVHDPLR